MALVIAAAVPLGLARPSTSAHPASSTTRLDPTAVLQRLPLSFEANTGQLDPSVRFRATTPGQTVDLTAGGLTLAPAGVHVTLAGADLNAPFTGLQKLPGTVSTFTGNDPSAWTSASPTYGSVAYRGVYPGVDVVFHGHGQDVEHDFVVAPGADPSVIGLDVRGPGGEPGRLDGQGDVVVGEVRLQAPVLYQDIGGHRRTVTGGYVADGDGRVGFAVGSYDHAYPLVIDPVVVSSTYLGGSSTDTAYGVALDPQGDMVVTGYTESNDFPTLAPAQTTPAVGSGQRTDVFVTKIKADGSAMLWSTYLGGKGRDAAFAVAVGANGEVFVTGYTESTDFPLVKPLQNFNGGGASDVFVSAINAAGTSLDYSTYIGGSGADSGSGIDVDKSGAVYVVGATASTNFPLARAFRTGLARPDDTDGFVLKIDPTLTALDYSSYLGGGGDDHAVDAALDSNGELYVTGDTQSADFPLVHPFQANPGGAGTGVGGNFTDAFVAKVKADGSGLVYSSYLGGSDADKGTGIAVDGTGAAYVTGNTGSSNFPVVNAYQPKKNGDFDAFVTKVKPDGSGLAYSTYLGGSGSDGGEAIAVDAQGHAYVTGATASGDFPTSHPFQSQKGGGFVDAFVTEFGAAGNSVVSSSYLGGKDDDQAASIAVGGNGNVAVVGYTNSNDFPIAKPFQPSKGGGVGDAFVTQIRTEVTGDAVASPGVAAAKKHDDRVRTLVTITGGLFLAAILQTVWLRRRPQPVPAPRPAPVRPPAPDLPGIQYMPRRGRLESRSVDGRSFTEEGGSATRTMLDDRKLDEAIRPRSAPADEEPPVSDDLWGPDRPWRAPPSPTPPSPTPPPPSRARADLSVPDLWETRDDRGRVRAGTGGPSPATALSGGDAWGDSATETEVRPADRPLVDADDLWGPLTILQDPDEWAREWGFALPEAPVDVAPAVVPAVETASPVEKVPEVPEPPAARDAPEPVVELAPEVVPEPGAAADGEAAPEPVATAVDAPPEAAEPEATAAAETVAEPEPVVVPQAEPEPELEPQPVAVPEPEPVAMIEPTPEPEPEVAEWAPIPGPEPVPVAVAESEPVAVPVAQSEPAPAMAEAEWLPIPPPEPEVIAVQPEPAQAPVVEAVPLREPHELSLSELLSEDLPIPEPVGGAPAPQPPPDPVRELLEEDFLPPPPPHLLVNLFEPDPDDPMVQALRAIEEAEQEDNETEGRGEDG